MGERRRMTGAAVRRIAAELSERDRAILADVARVRVLTGKQVDRLHFAGLQGVHRDRTRRAVLERLVGLQLLTPLERRIGGTRAGSSGLVFALGPAGQRLHAIEEDAARGRIRQPGTPTPRFMIHNLAVAELYVSLVEASRTGACTLVDYCAVPMSYWRTSEGGWIKPDAYAVVGTGDVEDSWAIEVDNATESLPTLRRKLLVYVGLAKNEECGPDGGPLPRVLVTVPDERRYTAVQSLLRTLPDPAEALFALTMHDRAVPLIVRVLRE
ncbi:replication-relaxation family protein [Phytohabitans sp. ZYX-F-186]|uniref:Replication-relaxation family protein n=1 Tax=Phytohabitans maris TaxID=3071409 RepID=A0ABU0Z7Q8_9ACTN|nr:replication-relaxation family protein [Phytohabitans sp. ZYX-F-186]MDQ7903089.1 replication-relaxation family protein [Phytohabitans sp. ZYX-F-186]